VRGGETVRRRTFPELWVPRTYFGIANGQPGGYVGESSNGPEAYTASVPLDSIYDRFGGICDTGADVYLR
jgi:hypothetical protein